MLHFSMQVKKIGNNSNTISIRQTAMFPMSYYSCKITAIKISDAC